MADEEMTMNSFTQSVYVVDDESGGGSGVSICEYSVDFNTGEVELLEKASVLYEQKKSGTLIGHFIMNVSDTVYQESYVDIFACSKSVNGSANAYNFYINLMEGGIVTLSANNADTHPTGYMNSDIG